MMSLSLEMRRGTGPISESVDQANRRNLHSQLL